MGMHAKRKLRSIRFHIGACVLGFVMIYPLLWLLASSFKSNDTMFQDTYSLIPKVWDAATNYKSGFSGIGGNRNSRLRSYFPVCSLCSFQDQIPLFRVLVWLCYDDYDDPPTGHGRSTVYHLKEDRPDRYPDSADPSMVFRRCLLYLLNGAVFPRDSKGIR